MEEKHVLIDGEPCSASIFDFALYFFHNAKLVSFYPHIHVNTNLHSVTMITVPQNWCRSILCKYCYYNNFNMLIAKLVSAQNGKSLRSTPVE
jgi:hypothetical protein